MFESMFPEPQQKDWYLLPLQVLCNLLLTWMLLSTVNIVFLLPFPYRDRLPLFLEIVALGLAIGSASGVLSLYRKRMRITLSGVLKTPPELIWSILTILLAVILAISIKTYPNQWSTY